MSIHSFVQDLLELDLKHLIRLIAIIGGYWFLRTQASKFLATRQLKDQVDNDNAEKQQAKLEELVEQPEDQESWGFGKKTRLRVKRQEKILQEALERAYENEKEDADIENLLE